MTQTEFIKGIRTYNKFNKADYDYIGFEFQKKLYVYKDTKISKALCQPYKESSTRGGAESIIISLKKADKERLIKNTKKCICIGSAELLNNGEKNRGDAFEKLLCRLNNQEWLGHNSVPFYKDGDLTINGLKIQAKFIKTRARLAYMSTLKRLA